MWGLPQVETGSPVQLPVSPQHAAGTQYVKSLCSLHFTLSVPLFSPPSHLTQGLCTCRSLCLEHLPIPFSGPHQDPTRFPLQPSTAQAPFPNSSSLCDDILGCLCGQHLPAPCGGHSYGGQGGDSTKEALNIALPPALSSPMLFPGIPPLTRPGQVPFLESPTLSILHLHRSVSPMGLGVPGRQGQDLLHHHCVPSATQHKAGTEESSEYIFSE